MHFGKHARDRERDLGAVAAKAQQFAEVDSQGECDWLPHDSTGEQEVVHQRKADGKVFL
jgi:hypothetical protein